MAVQGKVIDFWRAVEMFSPPAIPAARPSQRVFDIEPDQPLPWEEGHPLRRQQLSEKQAWRHTVYLGLYPRENIFEVLRGVFPADPDSFEERPSGSSALLALAVSGEGIMFEGSVVLSACAWATGRALDPGPAAADWLDGFADVEGQFAMHLEEIYLGWEDGKKRPLGPFGRRGVSRLASALPAGSGGLDPFDGRGDAGVAGPSAEGKRDVLRSPVGRVDEARLGPAPGKRHPRAP